MRLINKSQYLVNKQNLKKRIGNGNKKYQIVIIYLKNKYGTKIAEMENEISNTSGLVTKTMCNIFKYIIDTFLTLCRVHRMLCSCCFIHELVK